MIGLVKLDSGAARHGSRREPLGLGLGSEARGEGRDLAAAIEYAGLAIEGCCLSLVLVVIRLGYLGT